MQGFRTWLEAVEHLDDDIVESLITEQPHTQFPGTLPPALGFLQGSFVDLGFEDLGLPQPDRRAIEVAFAGTGVVAPGTSWRLRSLAPGRAAVEAVDGSEQATLPAHWRRAVTVTDHNYNPTWVGKAVRPDRIAGWNLTGYRDVGDGLVPP